LWFGETIDRAVDLVVDAFDVSVGRDGGATSATAALGDVLPDFFPRPNKALFLPLPSFFASADWVSPCGRVAVLSSVIL
jgi:hypothetical protein